MRLTKPMLQPPAHLQLDIDTDFLPDDEAEAVCATRSNSGQQSRGSRSHCSHPTDICNISGLLELPMSLGPLHLGEVNQFLSYIPCVNLFCRAFLTCQAYVCIEWPLICGILENSWAGFTDSGSLLNVTFSWVSTLVLLGSFKRLKAMQSYNCIILQAQPEPTTSFTW